MTTDTITQMEARGLSIGSAVAELFAYAGRSGIEPCASPISVEEHWAGIKTLVTFHGTLPRTSYDVEVQLDVVGTRVLAESARMREWDDVAREMGSWHEVI